MLVLFFHLAELKGALFGENPNRDFRIQKGFCVFLSKPKTDRESLKSTLCVDSSDQLQIRIFEIHLLSICFYRERIENSIFDKRFSEPAKKGYWRQMPYMYDINVGDAIFY